MNVNLGSVYAIFCSLFGRNSWVIQVGTFSNRRPKIQEMKCAYFSRPFFLLFEWLDDSWSSKIPLTIKSKKRVYDEAAMRGTTTCLKFRGSRLPFLTHVHYRVCSIKGPEISVFKKALDFDKRVISSFRSPFSTLRFSLKIKSFTKQNMFYRSGIFHDFSI